MAGARGEGREGVLTLPSNLKRGEASHHEVYLSSRAVGAHSLPFRAIITFFLALRGNHSFFDSQELKVMSRQVGVMISLRESDEFLRNVMIK